MELTSVNLFMAPLAGITDSPFRRLARAGGAHAVYTEMISSIAITHKNRRTDAIVRYEENERPIVAQIFGSSEKSISDSVKKITDLGFDGIDINCGCPARKIMKSGAGASLLNTPLLLAALINSAVNSTHLPVSVKIRPGINGSDDKSALFAKIAEDSGAKYVVLHARYVSQVHSGDIHISALSSAVKAVKIPVIANGGITDEQVAKNLLKTTGCAGLMIGRAAIGDFGIFKRIEHYLKTGEKLAHLSREEKIAALLEHARLASKEHGERWGIIKLRKLVPFYLKGMPGAKYVRSKINSLETLSDLENILSTWHKQDGDCDETQFQMSGRCQI